MSNDIKRGDRTPGQTGESQDALRHEEDALHHKVHRTHPGTTTEKSQDDGDNLQSEIPKVGSRDAPGG